MRSGNLLHWECQKFPSKLCRSANVFSGYNEIQSFICYKGNNDTRRQQSFLGLKCQERASQVELACQTLCHGTDGKQSTRFASSIFVSFTFTGFAILHRIEPFWCRPRSDILMEFFRSDPGSANEEHEITLVDR